MGEFDTVVDTSTTKSDVKSKEENEIPPAVVLARTSEEKPVAADTLGDARIKVQPEIRKEFTAMVASGAVHVTEAAALTTKKAVQKYDT
nr:hypothetical protein [Tanacetum cinerariifolium]